MAGSSSSPTTCTDPSSASTGYAYRVSVYVSVYKHGLIKLNLSQSPLIMDADSPTAS